MAVALQHAHQDMQSHFRSDLNIQQLHSLLLLQVAGTEGLHGSDRRHFHSLWSSLTHEFSSRMHHCRIHGAVVLGAEEEDHSQLVSLHQNRPIQASRALAKQLDCVPGLSTQMPPPILALCPCQHGPAAAQEEIPYSHMPDSG